MHIRIGIAPLFIFMSSLSLNMINHSSRGKFGPQHINVHFYDLYTLPVNTDELDYFNTLLTNLRENYLIIEYNETGTFILVTDNNHNLRILEPHHSDSSQISNRTLDTIRTFNQLPKPLRIAYTSQYTYQINL